MNVQDPRFAVGRGDEWRAGVVNQRMHQELELQSLDGDFRCARAAAAAAVSTAQEAWLLSPAFAGRAAAVVTEQVLACAGLTPRPGPSPPARAQAARPPLNMYRLPLNRYLEENVDLDETECASLDAAIPDTNVGYRLLQKLGWRGGGLGREQQGASGGAPQTDGRFVAAALACLLVGRWGSQWVRQGEGSRLVLSSLRQRQRLGHDALALVISCLRCPAHIRRPTRSCLLSCAGIREPVRLDANDTGTRIGLGRAAVERQYTAAGHLGAPPHDVFAPGGPGFHQPSCRSALMANTAFVVLSPCTVPLPCRAGGAAGAGERAAGGGGRRPAAQARGPLAAGSGRTAQPPWRRRHNASRAAGRREGKPWLPPAAELPRCALAAACAAAPAPAATYRCRRRRPGCCRPRRSASRRSRRRSRTSCACFTAR